MFYIQNDHSVFIVYLMPQTNAFLQELSFSVNCLFRVANKCFITRNIIQCLMVCSVPQTNASSQEISHSDNGLFGDFK